MAINKNLEKANQDLQEFKEKCEELRSTKQVEIRIKATE